MAANSRRAHIVALPPRQPPHPGKPAALATHSEPFPFFSSSQALCLLGGPFSSPIGSMHLNELKALHVSEVLKQAEALEIENTGRMRKQELMNLTDRKSVV